MKKVTLAVSIFNLITFASMLLVLLSAKVLADTVVILAKGDVYVLIALSIFAVAVNGWFTIFTVRNRN